MQYLAWLFLNYTTLHFIDTPLTMTSHKNFLVTSQRYGDATECKRHHRNSDRWIWIKNSWNGIFLKLFLLPLIRCWEGAVPFGQLAISSTTNLSCHRIKVLLIDEMSSCQNVASNGRTGNGRALNYRYWDWGFETNRRKCQFDETLRWWNVQ